MDKILKIINQIATTSGRNDKERILNENKNNELLKNIFKFVYDPYILTGLSNKKINKKIRDLSTVRPKDIQEMMEYLKINNTGKDIDIANIQNFIEKQPFELHDLYKQIFTKDLKIGATDGTLNKIYGKGFINSFEVMLAEKYFEHESKIKGKFIVTKKLDGNRNIAINDAIIKLFTRQGKPNEGFDDIESEIALLPKGYAYDGEFIVANDKDLNSADLYRETNSTVRKDGIKKNVIFHIFDMIPIEDFQNGVCNIPCIERKELLHNTLSILDLKWIKEVPILYTGEDKNKVIELLNQMISQNEEGIMINMADAPYECKRTKNILKVKKMQTCDLLFINCEEGEGRLSGTLGRINVEYKGNKIGVGSGFTDADRKYIWENKENLIGRVIEVQYFEESKNSKTGDVSLRFPVFKCIREIGKEVSYF